MRKFRLALAASGALLLAAAGLALATGGDSGTKRSSRLHVSRLAPTGAASGVASTEASNAQTTRIALPGLTRPLRNMPRIPDGKHNFKQGLHELSRAIEGTGASGGAPTEGVQTKDGSGDMPAPIQNFDGIARICGCLPPDTDGKMLSNAVSR